jgi:uncharacterized membrane protein YozB (DUF420 family)
MAGLFGTRAILQTDVDLLLQIAIVVILVVGYFYRKKAKKHGAIMAAATALEIVTLILFMGPAFIETYFFFFNRFTPLTFSFLVNISAGAAALILAVSLLVAWAIRFSNIAPFYKRTRKRIMDATIILWLVSFAFGVAGYVLAYV